MELRFEDRCHTQIYRTESHIYLLPQPALRPYVAHYTLCLGDRTAREPVPPLVLLPDASGCLVFTLQDGVLKGRMYGATTAAVTVRNDLKTCAMRFFVEFRPGGLRAFTPVPQWELADRVVPLEDLSSPLGAAVGACWEQAEDLDAFVSSLDRRLGRLCAPEGCCSVLLRTLAQSGASAPMAALAETTGYSPRHLSRLLREGAGMGGKAFVRVLRVNEAARRLQAGAPDLARLAQDLGYYDQSHFIHDFKAVSGVPPSAYLDRLSVFYNEPLKF